MGTHEHYPYTVLMSSTNVCHTRSADIYRSHPIYVIRNNAPTKYCRRTCFPLYIALIYRSINLLPYLPVGRQPGVIDLQQWNRRCHATAAQPSEEARLGTYGTMVDPQQRRHRLTVEAFSAIVIRNILVAASVN